MKTLEISLNTIDKVKDFANHSAKVETDVSIKSIDNHYIIDGKSIMGIFSLDLARNVLVTFDESEVEFEDYIRTLM